MKRLFLILLLLGCGFLYAETETYKTESGIQFSIDKPDIDWPDIFDNYRISSIIPYGVGYIIKYINVKNDHCFELYVEKGFIFYTHKYSSDLKEIVYYECKIIDIKPNEFTIDTNEIGRGKNKTSMFIK